MKTKSIFTAIILLSLNGIIFSQTTQIKKIIQLRPQGYYAIVDSLSGKVVTALKYDKVEPFKEGLAVFSIADKWGVIDNNGVEIVTPKYSSIKNFSETRAIVKMDNKYGIIDNKGKELIPCTYDYLSDFSSGLAYAVLSKKYGFLNLQGNPICPIKYDEVDLLIAYPETKLIRVKLLNKYGYINKIGKEIIAPQYDEAEESYKFKQGVCLVKKDSLWGAINENGTIIIPLKYKKLGVIGEGLIPFEVNGRYGYVNLKNEQVIKPIYQNADRFNGGLAIVKISNKWGVIDKMGKFIIPADYESSYSIDIKFNKNMPYIITRKSIEYENTGMNIEYAFCFDKTGKSLLPQTSAINTIWIMDKYIMTSQSTGNYGIYDFNGKAIIPNDYKEIREISNSVFMTINREKKYSVYNILGKQIIGEHDFMFLLDSLIYANNGGSLKDNKIQGGKTGMFDLSGNKICDLKYEGIGTFVNNIAVIELNKKYGFINKKGIEVVPPIYDYILHGQLFEGVATVNIGGAYNQQGQFSGGKWGFVNANGSVLLPIEYDYAMFFNEGLAPVLKNDYAGAIDKLGKIVIPFEYQDLGIFKEGIAYFVKDNLYGFIDKTGKIILNNTFQYAGDFNDGMAMVAKDNKVGYINKTGNIVIPIQYDNGDIFIDGYAIIVKNGQNHLINKKGEIIK